MLSGEAKKSGTLGPDLKGLGPVPAIAGRSPSYLIRQIYDMQVDARNGEWSPLMKPLVENLNEDDLIAIGAYVRLDSIINELALTFLATNRRSH